MGIITNTKQFLVRAAENTRNKVANVAKKAGDGIASMSALSPKQLMEIDAKRDQFLSGKPDMDGEETQAIIQKNMGAIGIEVYQAYLEQLSTIYSPVDSISDSFDADNRIRFFDITKWVTDREEKSLDKLVNVYHVLNEEDCNIALIYNRTKEVCRITIGIVNTDIHMSEPSVADNYYSRVIGAIQGNFPGVEIDGIGTNNCDYGVGIPTSLENITNENQEGTTKSIAIVSNVASEKSEEFISQSMEKLLDGIVPQNSSEEYTIVLLAKPIKEQLESKNRLYEIYTALSPYVSWQTGYTYTESDNISSSANIGVNLGVGAGMNKVKNQSSGSNILKVGRIDKQLISKFAGGVASQGTNKSEGESKGRSLSANFGVSFSRSSSVTAQVGKNESLTQTYTNYGIKHTLDIIEQQLTRIEESSALGMWEFASYVISESPVMANNVAHMYMALTQGEESYLTKAAVNFWDGDINTKESRIILDSVQKLQHPVFGLKTSLEDEWLMYPTLVTPTTPLSGKELAKALNFPRKSVSGLPVLDVVSFGREPHSLLQSELDLDIGCGYHMHKRIPEQRIKLSKEELTKHTFITGSTGSGKSNTIYRLLERLGEENVRFLVVEPAKGEYRDVIGKKKGVTTYGTNPKLKDSKLLRINPFRFPKNTHILEHLDRLIEIFNVCWPMYAAMPAILKDSVERAYMNSGWDLEKSENKYDDNLFPTFNDVVKQIKLVLEESDYSADNKGDYTGSLVTRLKSLTNGINGLIFSSDDITDAELFDRNVIVDLSRVGSSETKSLIMGLLVLKLQEHRMEQRCTGSNANDLLKHVTVLEEAHNLLKRTSTEQTSEGSNLVGKSVEMLANSIAEMRTYGEGFIIADQSPGLLDMSVIRNTNTKIILRLPDFSDRELVGKASGLTDNQIIELSKLEKGVAAISQSDWLEPVLCKIDRYEGKKQPFLTSLKEVHDKTTIDNEKLKATLLDCIVKKEIYRKNDRVDIQKLRHAVLQSKIDTTVKCDFLEYLSADKEDAKKALRTLVYDFLDANSAVREAQGYNNISEWVHAVVKKIQPSIQGYTNKQIDLMMAMILCEQTSRDASYNDIWRKFTKEYKEKGGVF